ncbi:hypothetical protein EC957_001664 [Mortierella hygrophila]|uniref:G-protein coupled receptors family 2 profile 2 domain-containing protein n=1 Tax=Mortierella hygrophila TaxID=979708 RepID=A0A9P6F5B1_9FUNG|nr:hypothetical protein EC957_001664 [Mortierella hygrophila]
MLPSRRKHPHLIVLVFSIMMVFWEGLGTAWLHMRTDLLCKNIYEPATMTNSWFCGVQGIGLMYIVLTMLCLGFLLIANLHVLSVFRSYVVQNHLTKLMVLSFFLPLSLVLPVAIRKQVENPGFGSICFVSSQIASPYFFYPLSVVVCLATLLHLGTIAFMIKSSVQNNSVAVSDSTSFKSQSDSQSNKTTSQRRRRLQTARDISQLLKQQWRPGLLALCLLIVYMIYWLFYFIEAKKLERVRPDTPWFMEWLACLAGQAQEALLSGRLSATSTVDDLKAAGDVAQGACAPISAPYVPSFTWAALADIMPAVFGIFVLIIFGSKFELWQDLKSRIVGEKDTTVFIMGDISKDQQHRAVSPEEQRYQKQDHVRFSQTTKADRGKSQDDDFYSDDLGLGENEFTSRDMIMAAYEAETPRYGGKQSRSRSRSGSHVAPPLPNTEAIYDGATRKTSVTVQDNDREPIYYRNPEPTTVQQEPIQKRLFHEQHALLVTDGAVPWPSWPSSTTSSSPTSPNSSSPSGNKPHSFDRHHNHHHRHTPPPPPSYPHHRDLTIDIISTRNPISHPLSPQPRVTYPTLPISPQKAFYNSEDISAPPISLSQPSRIDRQLKATPAPFYPPPPPSVAPPVTPKAYTQAVQSVVIPARGSSRDQGRVSSDRDRERPPRVPMAVNSAGVAVETILLRNWVVKPGNENPATAVLTGDSAEVLKAVSTFTLSGFKGSSKNPGVACALANVKIDLAIPAAKEA